MTNQNLDTLFSNMLRSDPINADRIGRALVTDGLEDLDLVEFLQAMIDAADQGKEEEDKLEPTLFVVTEAMFKKKNNWSDEIVWDEEEKSRLLEELNAYQGGYWLGGTHRPDKLLHAAKTNRLPITIEVCDKFGKRCVPDADYQKRTNDVYSSGMTGGNDFQPQVPKGY